MLQIASLEMANRGDFMKVKCNVLDRQYQMFEKEYAITMVSFIAC